MTEPHILSSTELFRHEPWRVTEETAALPDGRTKTALQLYRCDSVHVIAVPRPGHVILLREFRPFQGKHVWLLPSGKADKETDMKAAALRELREEAGHGAKDIWPFCTFYFADSITIRSHVFVAEDLYPDPLPQDATEMIEAHEVPLEEAIGKVLGMEPTHAVSAASLLRYAREEAA